MLYMYTVITLTHERPYPMNRFIVRLIDVLGVCVFARDFALESYAEEQALIWASRYPEYTVALTVEGCQGCAS
jgi:hypothetical protein